MALAQITISLKSKISFCHFETVLLVEKFHLILNKISSIFKHIFYYIRYNYFHMLFGHCHFLFCFGGLSLHVLAKLKVNSIN